MTTTPDATTDAAAPLTAAQIATVRAAYERHCVVVYMGDVEATDRTERNRLLYVEFNNLLLSHAALRDRLARAETRCAALEYENSKQRDMLAQAMFQLGGKLVVMPTILMDRRDWIITGPERRQPDGAYVWRVHRAAPTDGAARAGDAP
jgi:hypothetical protein